MPHHRKEPVDDSLVASRRQVLVGTTAGVAVVAAGALVATGAEAVAGPRPFAGPADDQPTAEIAADEHLVAHVRDLSAGHIDVFLGDRQVTIRDRAVATRLAAAASA